jgi:hypothetical protein
MGGTTDKIVERREEIAEHRSSAPVYIAVEYPEKERHKWKRHLQGIRTLEASSA